MEHSAALSLALALAAAAALAGGVLARLARQSTLTGYVLAGVLLGSLPFAPSVEDVETLANVGIVLLLFSLGVHFNFRDLAAVQRVALAGAVVQVTLTLLIGTGVAVLANWSPRQGLFLGAAAAISASTVIPKLLEERGEEDTRHGRIAVGWSVAQDLITVALVVMLSAVTGHGGNVAADALRATLLAAAFLTGMVVIGARALPWVLLWVARTNSRELFILAAAVLSVGAALLSEAAGLSLALGAFVAGLVVSEDDLSDQILSELLPTRDIFAALFFVSVGLLVDPDVVVRRLPLFVLMVFTILAIKLVLAAGLTRLLGETAHTALMVGATLAASAEFSFLLARIGFDSDTLTRAQFGLIVAATSASIVLGPLLFLPAPWILRRLGGRQVSAGEEAQPPVAARAHVVICGHGRVGGLVADTLRRRGYRYVVVEQDRRLVERLRGEGNDVVYGNAMHPMVLERAGVKAARTMVVTITDPIMRRALVRAARELNPRLDIVARVSGPGEAAALQELGVGEAVIAERELALEITRHTLHRLGLSTLETQAVIQAMRFRG